MLKPQMERQASRDVCKSPELVIDARIYGEDAMNSDPVADVSELGWVISVLHRHCPPALHQQAHPRCSLHFRARVRWCCAE